MARSTGLLGTRFDTKKARAKGGGGGEGVTEGPILEKSPMGLPNYDVHGPPVPLRFSTHLYIVCCNIGT